MELTTQVTGTVRVITVNADRLDAAVAVTFKDMMRTETAGGPGRYVLDLHQVAFMDSSGLGAVVASLKQMPKDAKLELANLSETVGKVFRLTRMDKVLTIHDTVEAALEGGASAA